ncbi:apolipoprotein A-I-like [Rhinophrynus dorsalis]
MPEIIAVIDGGCSESAELTVAGTQADLLRQHEEPQTPVQQAREIVGIYQKKAQDIGREAVDRLESSDLGKQLELKITEKFDTLSDNVLNLKKKLNVYVDSIREQVAKELEKDFPVVGENIQPAPEAFQKRWVEEVKVFLILGAELHKMTKDNLETLYKKLIPIVEEVRDKLKIEVDSLQSNLEPHSYEIHQKLAQKLEEFKGFTYPIVKAYVTELSQHIKNLKERFGPQAQSYRDLLLPHAVEATSKLLKAMRTMLDSVS